MDWAIDAFDEDAVAAARTAVGMEEPWALIERFAELVRESGSEDERLAAEYLAGRLDALGIEHEVHEPELYLSVPRGAAVQVAGRDPAPWECKTPAFSGSTVHGAGGAVDGWLEGELVPISTDRVGGTSDLFTAAASVDPGRVRDKIVLAEGFAMPKIVRQIEEAGARAAVFINPGHAHEGIVTTIWGVPSLSQRDRIPEIVVVNVPKAVGEELRGRLDTSGEGVRVRLRTELFRGWAACPVVVAEVPGETPDFTLVHGHYDSWHEGIGDNAVGDAALLEVARVAHEVRDRLWRGVRVAWWPAHSTGRYAGSTWFADRFAIELRNHCVAQVDVDSPGCRWATAYDEVMWMAEAEAFGKEVIRAAAASEAHGMRPLRAGDYSFHQIGLTGFFMLLSNIPEEVAEEKGFYPVGGCGGNSDAWHTEGDTLAVADRENLERDIHVYVEAVVRLSTAPFLPFDYRATVREIVETVEEYGRVADDALDLEPLTAVCDSLLGDLDRFYDHAADALGAAGGSANAAGTLAAGDRDRHEALRAWDRLQLELARELVPVGYSAERRYYHDPAMEVPPVPDLAILRRWPDLQDDDDGRRFLLAEATRGRNRITDAILRARERVTSLRMQDQGTSP